MQLFRTLPMLALAAMASVSMAAGQSSPHGPDDIIPFAKVPTESGASTNETTGDNRELQVFEGVVGADKDCQQVACWFGTNSHTCALSVIEKIQNDMMMGRDRYGIESLENNGAWARFWRTKFEPIDRGDIATGTCSNGSKFVVTNCMSTGEVYC